MTNLATRLSSGVGAIPDSGAFRAVLEIGHQAVRTPAIPSRDQTSVLGSDPRDATDLYRAVARRNSERFTIVRGVKGPSNGGIVPTSVARSFLTKRPLHARQRVVGVQVLGAGIFL